MKSRGKVWLSVTFCILTVAVVVATSLQATAQVPKREFIYTANFADDNVPGFSLNLSNGKATELPGSPFRTGVGPVSFAHSPDGRFVYAVMNSEFLGSPCGFNNGELISYSVNPRTGALTLIDDVVLSGVCSTGVAVDPTGKFVYAASFPESGDAPKVGIIDGFRTSNGHLMPLPGTPFASPIEVGPGQTPAIEGLAITPNGKVLYASDPADPRGILIFDRDTQTGALAFRAAVNTGSSFDPIVITPSGRFLIALGAIENGIGLPGIFEFEIGKHGNLTPVQGSPFPLPHDFGSSVSISPDGDFVAVVGMFAGITGKGISIFRENARGSLSLIKGSPFGDVTAFDITFDPSGRFVLVPGTVFKVHPGTGALTKVSEFSSGFFTEAITVVRTCSASDEDRDDKREAINKDRRDHDDRQDRDCDERERDRDRD